MEPLAQVRILAGLPNYGDDLMMALARKIVSDEAETVESTFDEVRDTESSVK